MSAYSHMMRTGDFNEQETLIAQPIDERSAKLPDGTRLRMTPKGQKTVDLLTCEGDIIKTSYGTGGKVIEITRYTVYDLPVHTITYVVPEARRFLDGHYSSHDRRWINECVAQDNRILMLFENNQDEVLVVQKAVGFLTQYVMMRKRSKKQMNH